MACVCAVGNRLGAIERFGSIGIRHLVQQLWIGELGKSGELATPAFAHRLSQFLVVIGEEEKGRRACGFLPHEEKRYLRTQQLQSDGGLKRQGLGERRQTFTQSAIADLIVVLEKQHERRRRQIDTRATAALSAAVPRRFALINK